MKNKYVKTLFLLLLLVGVVGYAQTVSGLVTSDDGPLPGATVVVKGINNGSTADFDVREVGARLGEFSFKQFGPPDMDNNFPIVRLGEMYLTRAEALARNGNDWNLALPDTNIIRARAVASAYTALNAEEFLMNAGERCSKNLPVEPI